MGVVSLFGRSGLWTRMFVKERTVRGKKKVGLR